MELGEALARRRMVRSFDGQPVAPEVRERVLDAARRGPSAGNSQGIDLVVLEGRAETDRYWEAALPGPEAHRRFRWQGLLGAPVLVVVVTWPGAYAARYAEADKREWPGGGPASWPVPYWLVDAGMAVMAVLLAAVAEGLGAAFFSAFDRTAAVGRALGIPEDRLMVGTVALGHPAPDQPGRSAGRPRRPRQEVVHRGRW